MFSKHQEYVLGMIFNLIQDHFLNNQTFVKNYEILKIMWDVLWLLMKCGLQMISIIGLLAIYVNYVKVYFSC